MSSAPQAAGSVVAAPWIAAWKRHDGQTSGPGRGEEGEAVVVLRARTRPPGWMSAELAMASPLPSDRPRPLVGPGHVRALTVAVASHLSWPAAHSPAPCITATNKNPPMLKVL